MTLEPGVPQQRVQPQVPYPPAHAAAYEPGMPQPAPQLNYTYTVTYKGGWPGLFTGENQSKALDRSLRELNSRGHRVAAAVTDRWSFWKRLGMVLIAIISLGFFVRVPNVILITEPIR